MSVSIEDHQDRAIPVTNLLLAIDIVIIDLYYKNYGRQKERSKEKAPC